MTLTQLFLDELEREAPRTRRALEQVPLGRDDWKPHPKSMPLGRLAGLVASMPSWIGLIIEQDELNLTPPPGQGTYQQPATDALVAVHDANVQKGRGVLSRTTDEFLMTTSLPGTSSSGWNHRPSNAGACSREKTAAAARCPSSRRGSPAPVSVALYGASAASVSNDRPRVCQSR